MPCVFIKWIVAIMFSSIASRPCFALNRLIAVKQTFFFITDDVLYVTIKTLPIRYPVFHPARQSQNNRQGISNPLRSHLSPVSLRLVEHPHQEARDKSCLSPVTLDIQSC